MTKGENIPVALFVFNRYEHLNKTLEALKNNNISELFVFCDGPRNTFEENKVNNVRQIIDSIDWIKPEKIYHKKNIGLSESISFGLKEVFKTHDKVIVVEDDIVVAPDFFNYMSEMLAKYEDETKIAGVTGLRYPFKLPADYSDSVFFAPRFSSWGWGTWKRFWDDLETDKDIIKDKLDKLNISPSKGGADLEPTFKGYFDGTLSGSWDVCFEANILINDQYFIWPTWNMVQNTGFTDGSHAGVKEPEWKLEWEKRPSSLSFPQYIIINDKIYKNFLSFFKQNTQGDKMLHKLRHTASKVKRKLSATDIKKPDPKDYTTTDGPMEVPVQVEAYYIALNNYMKDGDRVLDVGCGIGYGLNLLSIKAKEVYGVDVDKKAIKYCEERLVGKNPKLKELKLYDGYHLPYKDKFFDVITSIDVIEHVEDYDKFVNELLRVAKRAVIISTPNRRPENTNQDGTPKNYWHLREWSRPELHEILSKHDAKISWHHVNGTWEGPFTVTTKEVADTQTLTPALLPKK